MKIRIFTFSAGVILAVTAIAKLVSSGGGAVVLQRPDPIFGISFRHVFWLAGILELAIALVCLFDKNIYQRIGLLAWLVTNLVVYRLGLVVIGYKKPCPCLGSMTENLHISAQTADMAMKIVLAYLLIGSYATLFWLWRQRKNAIPTSNPA